MIPYFILGFAQEIFSLDNNVLHRAMLQHRIENMQEEISCIIHFTKNIGAIKLRL